MGMTMMESLRKDNNPKPLYPIWGCTCGAENALLVCGCLEYEKISASQHKIAKPHCQGCAGNG
jgi:hypothetical protein